MSLVRALLRANVEHEFWLALNGSFPQAVEEVRSALADVIEPGRIRSWRTPNRVSAANPLHAPRRAVAEVVRDAFLQEIRPDLLYVSSIFEGLNDDAVTSTRLDRSEIGQAATLYDLIPLQNAERYLQNIETRRWYYSKLQALKQSDLLCAISEHTRSEAIDRLRVSPARIVNISGAVGPGFRPLAIGEDAIAQLKRRYGLSGPFIMYTGGFDARKNIDGLIRAYALLDASVKHGQQLAIVCSITDSERRSMADLARSVGLGAKDVVFTGYVAEADLVALYNACELFVFPSLQEGFGLPALEAMSCGAPTIGADNSSIPEVIGLEAALFDARRPAAIAAKMTEALTDRDFRARLREHGLERARSFSWDESASRVLDAMSATQGERGGAGSGLAQGADRRRRLAFVSPLPPLESGIARYSAELLRELSRFYEIEVVTDQPEIADAWVDGNFPQRTCEQFVASAASYDRVVYQLGNSELHAHMPGLMRACPGVVVLHDYFLSGLNFSIDQRQRGYFLHQLVECDGYAALDTYVESGLSCAMATYPMNAGIVGDAMGLIVHSQAALARLAQEHGLEAGRDAHHVPHPRSPGTGRRDDARRALAIGADATLVCAFGFVAASKLSLELLRAFAASTLARGPTCTLVFVGQASGDYGEALDRQIRALGLQDRVQVTGFVEHERYLAYLAAADIAVQLRANSRGETSGAALDCLAHGVPTIVNVHGTMAELDDSAVMKIGDPLDSAELAAALESLRRDKGLRGRVAAGGRRLIASLHSPEATATAYFEAIERSYALSRQAGRIRSARQVARALSRDHFSVGGAVGIATDLSSNRAPGPPRRIYIDVTTIADEDGSAPPSVAETFANLLRTPPSGWRVEPVRASQEGNWTGYRLARRFAVQAFGLAGMSFTDDVMEPRAGDLLVGLGFNPIVRSMPGLLDEYRRWRTSGVGLYFALPDAAIPADAMRPDSDVLEPEGDVEAWMRFAASAADGLVCGSTAAAQALEGRLHSIGAPGRRPTVRSADLQGLVVGAPPAVPGRMGETLPQLLDLIVAEAVGQMA
jgi:glycosyltransferase involved in cell wall biosynthesis